MPRITMVLLSYTISIKEKRLYAEQKKNAKIVVLPIRKCPLYILFITQTLDMMPRIMHCHYM